MELPKLELFNIAVFDNDLELISYLGVVGQLGIEHLNKDSSGALIDRGSLVRGTLCPSHPQGSSLSMSGTEHPDDVTHTPAFGARSSIIVPSRAATNSFTFNLPSSRPTLVRVTIRGASASSTIDQSIGPPLTLLWLGSAGSLSVPAT
jgi:hypothetical protein